MPNLKCFRNIYKFIYTKIIYESILKKLSNFFHMDVGKFKDIEAQKKVMSKLYIETIIKLLKL